jgi:predicted extracellular nuclease
VAATILAVGAPTVIGLQEVENLKILEEIASQPAIARFRYKPVLVEGSDIRGIDVGFLVRQDQAKVLEFRAYPDTSGLFSRPPLLVQIEAQTSRGKVEFFALNNHFLSMSTGVEATLPRRLGQANWNAKLVKDLQEKHPTAKVAVLGDLNSFFQSSPIDALRAVPMKHAFEWLPPEGRYTYIYQGESQVLDHILLTPNLGALVRRVDVLHVNADFPPPDPADDTPIGKSDHDPVVVTFSISP